jgi:acetoin utilization protein AcuC
MNDHVFIYDPPLSDYELSSHHPFKPIRLELTRSLLQHMKLLSPEHERRPQAMSEAQLLSMHSLEYVEMVKAVSKKAGLKSTGSNRTGSNRTGSSRTLEEAYSYGLGTSDNPIFPHMHEAIMGVCAATLSAVDLVASGQATRALNLSGGLHHAHKDRASGFCIYNDLAIAIEHAVRTYQMRVAYVDIDAHHGDGVQGMFYDRADVMTISLHESGRYLFPGTGHTYETGKDAGHGFSVNLPLEPFSQDDSYLEAFEAIVPAALRSFQPDLIVLQAGTDMHRYDPLANLALSVQGMNQSYQRISELADEVCQGRLVATGGGGYDPYRTVPRAWASLWAAMSRQDIPKDIPQAWINAWQNQSPIDLPKAIHDDLSDWQANPRHPEIVSHNRVVVKRLLNGLEPIWKEGNR